MPEEKRYSPEFQRVLDEVRAVEEANKPYWRLYLSYDDEPVVVCLQPFDEYDADQSRFINTVRYDSERAAEQALLAIKAVAAQPRSLLERLKAASAILEQG